MFQAFKNAISKIFSPTKNNSQSEDETFKPVVSNSRRQRVSFDPHITETHFKQPIRDSQSSRFCENKNNSFTQTGSISHGHRVQKQENFNHSMQVPSEYDHNNGSFLNDSMNQSAAKRARFDSSLNSSFTKRNYFGQNSSAVPKNNFSQSQSNFNGSINRSNQHSINLVQASPAKEILRRLTEMAENSQPALNYTKKNNFIAHKPKKTGNVSKMFSLPHNHRTRLNQTTTVTKAKNQIPRQNSDANLKRLNSKNQPKKFAFSYQPVPVIESENTNEKEIDEAALKQAVKPKAPMWKCQICCFSNDDSDDNCAACDTLRPGKFKPTKKEPLLSQPASFIAKKNDTNSATFKSKSHEPKTIAINETASKPAIKPFIEPKNEVINISPAEQTPKSSGFSFKPLAKTPAESEKTDDSFKLATSNSFSKPDVSPSLNKATPTQMSKPFESTKDNNDDGFVGGFSLAGSSTQNWSKNEGAFAKKDLDKDSKPATPVPEMPKVNPFAQNKESKETSAPKPEFKAEVPKFSFSVPKSSSDVNSGDESDASKPSTPAFSSGAKSSTASTTPSFSFKTADTSNNASPTPKFSFGAKTEPDQANQNSSASFSFGPKSDPPQQNTQSSTTFSFGQKSELAQNTQNSTGFSFGAKTTETNSNNAPSSTGFSFGQNQNKTSLAPSTGFSFGAKSETSTNSGVFGSNNASTANPFGTKESLEQKKPESPSFSFNTAPSNAATSQNQPQSSPFTFGNSQPTTNLFGQTSNTNNTGSTGANIFSNSASNKTEDSSSNKAPFLFGTQNASSNPTSIFSKQSNANESTPNLFQTSNQNNTSGTVFSFGNNQASSNDNKQSSNDSGNNMFNANQRLIKKAFRRM